MIGKKPAIVIGILIASQLFGPAAHAHQRDYLVNQPYYTTKQGEFEVAFYNDMNLPEMDNDDTYNSKHQIEVEYGITDHLQAAFYEVYTWDRAEDWSRDEFKIEAKYRFAEPGQLPLDIALYGEYANPNGSRETHSDDVETKLILSKDIGVWNFTANLIAERAINENADWDLEYTAGVNYAVTPRTRLGLELQQQLGNSDSFHADSTQPAYIIPGIYTNILPNVRILVGPAFGLTRASNDVQFKSLVEVEF